MNTSVSNIWIEQSYNLSTQPNVDFRNISELNKGAFN
jgi:hypothetical protein